MKPSLKLMTSLIGAFSLSLGIGYSAMAQTTPNSGRTPGMSNDPAYSNPQTNPQNSNQPFNNPPRSQTNIMVSSSADSESIGQIVRESPSFTMFNSLLRVAMLEEPELGEKLGSSDDSYTVYAPTDAAFASLPEGTIRRLVQPENRDLLVEILSYHIVTGDDAMMADAPTSTDGELGSTEGQESVPGQQNLPIQQSDRETASIVLNNNEEATNAPVLRSDRASGNMMVNNARVIGGSIQAENGTIYPIDQVIIPPSVGTELGLAPQSGTSNQAF